MSSPAPWWDGDRSLWSALVRLLSELPATDRRRALVEAEVECLRWQDEDPERPAWCVPIFDDLSLAGLLADLAAATGDQRLRFTARVLSGDASPGGRAPIDDDSALAQIDQLIATSVSANSAYRRLARRIAAQTEYPPKLESIITRLKRKHREARRKKVGT